MFKPDVQQELVRCMTGKGFEDTAEMERAHMTMTGYLLQRNIIGKMFGKVFLGPLDGGEVVLFKPGIDPRVGFIISDIAQYLVQHFHHQVVQLQFGACFGKDQFGNMKMQELCFGIGGVQGGMHIIVFEEFGMSVMFQNFPVEVAAKFKDGAFIRNSMGMCYGTFITWFGDEDTATVRIQ